jgi:DNA-binding IclR family transcriptional regulator
LHVGASGHVLCAGTEVLAAINITGPSGRLFAEQMNELAPEVTRAVREISQKRALLWMGLA